MQGDHFTIEKQSQNIRSNAYENKGEYSPNDKSFSKSIN